ncbi:MAG: CDGSH iron-sulfur domain-containing protein [Gemmatimonadota bacterium]|nr:MAG: CDGSH iron-sulfur domain-containing protein [Gemmatimonadota bacterium]
MSGKIREYEGRDIVVNYDVKRCIHAEECVKGLPGVFVKGRRPWIDPDAAAADEVAEVVVRCPTGALWYERKDGGMAEPVADKNTAEISRDGPINVSGDIEVASATGEALAEAKRISLCRCGASANKPFCDGSHSQVGFEDAGDLAEAKARPDEFVPGGRLTVTPLANGPLLVKGSLEVRSADGETSSYHDTQAALCRCGGSSKKPFCDGTHKQIGFSAD